MWFLVGYAIIAMCMFTALFDRAEWNRDPLLFEILFSIFWPTTLITGIFKKLIQDQ